MKEWKDIAVRMLSQGWQPPQSGVRIRIPDAEKELSDCFQFCLDLQGKDVKFSHLPEYAKIASWLQDNKGKGLLMFGNCGRGKTFIARYVLPLLINKHCGKILSFYDMTYAIRHTDEILSQHLVALDDIGTEQKYNDYGTIRHTLDELIDAAEKYGKLIILTTNLNKDELIETYGERVFDRLCTLTTRVAFVGESLRSR